MKISPGNYRQLLWHYFQHQLGTVLVMAIFLLASIAFQLIGPQVARSFIDSVRAGTSTQALMQAALIFILVTAAHKAMNVLATYWSEKVSWTATNNLRADLALHLVRLDLSFHKARTPGEIIERVDGDVNALAGFFSSFVVQLVGSLLLLIGILGATYLVNIQLGLSFTIFVIFSLVLLSRIRRLAAPHWKEDRECSAIFYGYLGEVFTATEDIRANHAENYAFQRFFSHLRRWMPVRVRAGVWESGVWMAALAVFALGEALAYSLGGGLYRAGAITLGAVYMVIAYTAMLADPIESIRTQLQELQRADANITRIRELLAIRSRLKDGTEILPTGPLSVAFQHVSFGYEDEQFVQNIRDKEPEVVINSLSFTLEKQRVLGVLGHTGSGKTTVARLLFRLYDPQQGEVCLADINLRSAKLKVLRERVGFVTQEVQLFDASLRDNITFFDPQTSDETLCKVLTSLGLQSWLTSLPDGLDTMISNSSLSAGEAQLVALARVFLKDPGFIILDEASSRLDPATEILLEQALDKLLIGRTAVIIAHRLATIERVDDILILDRGCSVEYGPREKLVANPNSQFARLRQLGLGEVLA